MARSIETEAIAMCDEFERFMRCYFGKEWERELSEHELADGTPLAPTAKRLSIRVRKLREIAELREALKGRT